MSEAVARQVSREAWWNADAYPLILIAQAWVAMLVVIYPLGNFPVIDDWAYFASVKALVERGQLFFSNWTATNLISQIAWGAVFAFIFGTSYTVLRFSTLLLALLGTGALYLTLRESGTTRGTALLGALLFLFNPLVCLMSASFMSDVPYAAAQVMAILLLIRGLKSRSKRELWSGWCMAAIALLCRQVGMAIPVGYGAARLALARPVWRGVLPAAVPFTAFAAIQFLFQSGLQHWHVLPTDFGRQIDFMALNIGNSSPLTLAGNVLLLGIDCARFLGFCLLPLSVLLIAQYTQMLPRIISILIWFWMAVVALLVASIEPPMREWSNVSWTLIGPDVAGVPHSPTFWAVISTASAFGGIALALSAALKSIPLFRNLRNTAAIPALFSLVTAAALFGAMALLPRDKQFDRYIIPLIPCFILFLSARTESAPSTDRPIPRWAAIASNALFTAIAAWSLLGTHDYFAEKRVQWAALQDLVQNDHVPPDIIDAGWAYNAPTSFGLYGDPNRVETWFRRQDYFIGSNMLPDLARAKGFTLVRDYPIAHWAPWNMVPARIVTLRRIPPN